MSGNSEMVFYSASEFPILLTFSQTIAQNVIEFWNVVNLSHRLFKRIRDSPISDPIVFQNKITGTRVPVAGLTHATHVN